MIAAGNGSIGHGTVFVPASARDAKKGKDHDHPAEFVQQ